MSTVPLGTHNLHGGGGGGGEGGGGFSVGVGGGWWVVGGGGGGGKTLMKLATGAERIDRWLWHTVIYVSVSGGAGR